MSLTVDEYKALPVKASIKVFPGTEPDDYPALMYCGYKLVELKQYYYESSSEIMPVYLHEVNLNAGRFVKFDAELRSNVVKTEVCPAETSFVSDWDHIPRFKERVRWCRDNVDNGDTWSMFVHEENGVRYFAFGFSNIETAVMFKLHDL